MNMTLKKLNRTGILIAAIATIFTIVAIIFGTKTNIFNILTNKVELKEGTEEQADLDNWEISTVFYDSTVDGGVTPLTEINWDASDGTLEDGETRVITVQINYKNDKTLKSYETGTLTISIPNLIYSNSTKSNTSYEAKWSASVIVGANDSTHSGYEWDLISGNYPSRLDEQFIFSNSKTFEANTNFEGSIQITYTITPTAVVGKYSDSVEKYLEECTKKYDKVLKATLKEIYPQETLGDISSPNYPNGYPGGMSEEKNFVEYTDPTANELKIRFSEYSRFTHNTASYCDYIKIYDRNGNMLYHLSGVEMAGKTYVVPGNYVKITMFSLTMWNSNRGFTAFINETDDLPSIESNEISFNYKRHMIHPWQQRTYSIEKKASQITSLDGFPTGDYYWVKYNFKLNGTVYSLYPYVGADYYIEDKIPEDCVILDNEFNIVTPENNIYKDSQFLSSGFSSYWNEYIYIGYPKEVYNEESNNMNITNTVDLYVKYHNENEYKLADSESVTINLADFDFKYTGDLYSIQKTDNYHTGILYSNFLLDQNYINECSHCGQITSEIHWNLLPTAIYTGTPITVRFGDDLMYITDSTGQYRKLNEDEYWISNINIPKIKNKNGVEISRDKYPISLYVRYANEKEYKLHSKITSSTWNISLEEDKKVVAYYFEIEDMKESLVATNEYSPSVSTIVKPKDNIGTSGKIYNFGFINVYYKDENSNLVLQNEPLEESYFTLETKEKIASYDLDTYGHYVQRGTTYEKYDEYTKPEVKYYVSAGKRLETPIQDAENEIFTIKGELEASIYGNNIKTDKDNEYYMKKTYFDYVDDLNVFTGFSAYDLLPKGLEIIETEEELINQIKAWTSSSDYDSYFFKTNGDAAFSDANEWAKFVREHSTITITENWENTGRTKIEWKVDFSDEPLVYLSSSEAGAHININYKVSYDSFLEYGETYQNYIYSEAFFNNNQKMDVYKYYGDYEASDNGEYDCDVIDINENGSTTDIFAYSKSTATITSVVSTHQDITTYVQTDKSNYSTGVVEASYGSNYEYKLRARTGSADVTNLIIYTNLEEAQTTRKYWKGEFLGIDTSYAESKGYTVKTYYSEKIDAGTLSEDTSWKEYTDTVDKTKVKSLAFQYLDTEGNPAILPANSLTYVLIKMKAPSDENIKTLAYNNSWTQWNAIDPITKLPVDFITGINSNVVKVSLPNSVEYADIEISLEKIWEDNNDSLSLRPTSIKYKLISNNDLNNITEITLSNIDATLEDTNKWVKIIEVPKYDEDGNEITYTIEEEPISLDNNYKYISKINNYSVTNTLSKELTITKKWIDNDNSYLTRPSNVNIKVLQNGNEYKNILITGDYSTNEWIKTIDVPVYDNEGKEYNYTLEEVNVDNYRSSYDSSNYTFTNTLTGEEKISITKKWIDNSNKYNTRPESITIKLKQNNKDYKTLTLNGNNDTWSSEEITVPKYDSNGIKYNYTIEEDVMAESYGIIEYDQANYKVTNTLKQNIDIIVTKNWLDDNNSYNTRPNNLTITLLQNNKEYKTLTLSGNTNTWTTSIEVPKYDDNQIEYKYSIKELNENIKTEYSDVTYSEDGLSVTNKLKKDIDLTITKNWIDYNNEYKTRPEKIIINLFQNGKLYKELELTGTSNTWETKVIKVPTYDDNGIKYSYTIEEVSNDKLKKYQKITYDQTNLTVSNELTEKPKVTLYFTVKNGYTETDGGEVKFDAEGLKNALEKNNINADEEYIYKFELQNTVTGDIYEGKLSTTGVLEFPDLPYGTYQAVESEDEYFDFVSMLNIEEIPGVTFEQSENGGIIKIEPTGEDIIYGVNVINKIETPKENPPTKTGNNIFILITIAILIIIAIKFFITKKNNLS